MNRNINCVKLKNDLQRKLLLKYKPKNIFDYYQKMQKSLKNNKFYQEFKKQSENQLIIN